MIRFVCLAFALTLLAAVLVRSGAATMSTARADVAPVTLPAPAIPADVGFSVDLPAVDLTDPSVYMVPEMTIVGQASRAADKAAKVAAHGKRWTCGAYYDNAVGGRNADCYWR